jgi:uncharacterized protein (UPF0248 family)
LTLRELFNEHKWHRGDLDELRVTVRHRGAPGGERVVYGARIEEVTANGLVIDGDDETFLPYHRVLRVTGTEGVIWKRGG